jgi:hypothetical protein
LSYPGTAVEKRTGLSEKKPDNGHNFAVANFPFSGQVSAAHWRDIHESVTKAKPVFNTVKVGSVHRNTQE